MILLSAENLEKNFGERILFTGLNIGLQKGDKAALIAANGTGKTSLLRILAGIDQPEAGKVVPSNNIRIALLEQEPCFKPELSIAEQIKLSGSRINKIISEYKSALESNDSQKIELAGSAMDIADAWDYDRKLGEMMDRFAIRDTSQKIGTLSGGQIKRLALALALMDHPDLLLLDEPTNHLDIDMIEWLEDYLGRSNISFLMVTHDRYFLDNVCNIIFELANNTVYIHKGNYEYFLRNREDRENAEKAEIERAKSYVRNDLEWIRRMPKARGSKSKSRIDSFNENLRKSKVKTEEKELKLEIAMSRLGGKVLEMKKLSKSFGDKEIVKDFSYSFKKGERIGIIGSNGSGKSTFLNLLTGILKPGSGTIDKGETIQMAYYRQEGIEYEETKKIIEVVTDIAEVIQTAKGNRLTASQFLTHFMFPPNVQHQTVASLSGGEKRRLYLLTILIRNPNFLILDEPTNDLDLLSLQKLEEFLEGFGGCLVIVSHDRFLLDKLCDTLFIFEGNANIRNFVGPYASYSKEKQEKEAREKSEKKEKQKSLQSLSPKPVQTKKGLSFKEKRELASLENEISELEKEKNELQLILNSGSEGYEELNRISKRVAEIIDLLDLKEERWLDLDDRNNQ